MAMTPTQLTNTSKYIKRLSEAEIRVLLSALSSNMQDSVYTYLNNDNKTKQAAKAAILRADADAALAKSNLSESL